MKNSKTVKEELTNHNFIPLINEGQFLYHLQKNVKNILEQKEPACIILAAEFFFCKLCPRTYKKKFRGINKQKCYAVALF